MNKERKIMVKSNDRIDSQLINSSFLSNQVSMAVKYGKSGMSIFPCNADKSPIVDPALGYYHGLRNSTTIPKVIAKTWHKYPDAAIGWAIPRDIIVIDCDVLKDDEKRPILKDDNPDIIGLRSFEELIIKLNLGEAALNTLTVKTQSGGRHFFFRMPEGSSSFNHTHAMEGLDLKGYGGYVILPNSQGQHGRYEFMNLTEIKPIPDPLLNWISSNFNDKISGKYEKLPIGTAKIDREEIIRILAPYWAKADGLRNDFTLSIAGFIARSGGTEQDAKNIISELCRLTGKGHDHIPGVRYAFNRDGPVKGLSSIEKIMGEIKNE